MKALDWLRDTSKPELRAIYTIQGDDLYLRRQCLGAISRLALPETDGDLGLQRFTGLQATLADVFDALRTPSFFSTRRLVIIEDADPFVSKNRRELETYVDLPGRGATLVLVVKTWPANTRLATLIEERGLFLNCKSPSEKEVHNWLVHEATTAHGAKLDIEAARLLLEMVGPDVGLLASEVEKLAVYVGDTKHIRQNDVTKLVEAGRLETIWQVIDAATTGRAATAIQSMDDLLAAGEFPARLLAAMSSSLLKTHHAGRLRAARLDTREACLKAGIFNSPIAIEGTKRQHAHLGPSRVDKIPAMLLRADLDLKGNSPLNPRVIFEELIISLALPRPD